MGCTGSGVAAIGIPLGPTVAAPSSVASGGKIVQIGVLTGFGSKPDLTRVQWENADIIGVTVGSSEHFTAMNRFLADHAIHPILDRVYGFDEAPEAFAHLRTGSHFGKIVVKL